MKKYTIKSIKQTPIYKANIEDVRATYPAHAEDFARELMIAANTEKTNFCDVFSRVEESFNWENTTENILNGANPSTFKKH